MIEHKVPFYDVVELICLRIVKITHIFLKKPYD